jgi:hypothetical protein
MAEEVAESSFKKIMRQTSRKDNSVKATQLARYLGLGRLGWELIEAAKMNLGG